MNGVERSNDGVIQQAIESAKCRIYKLNFDLNGKLSAHHQKKAENQKELMEITVKALERYDALERVIEQIQALANEFQEGYYHEVHCKNREDNCEWKDCCSCVLERAIEIIKEEMM